VIGNGAFQPWEPIRRSGVYMFLRGDAVIYVGQSLHVDARIPGHGVRMKYTSVIWIQVPEQDLDDYEGALIRALDPECNGKATGTPSRDAEILARLGLEPDPDSKFVKRITEIRRQAWMNCADLAARRRATRKRIRAFVEAA
jgi:hypothetical protein